MTSAGRPSGRHHHGDGASTGVARRLALRAGQVLAAVLSAALFAGSAYAWSTYRSFRSHAHVLQVAGLGHGTAQTAPDLQHVVGNAQNLLIVGIDSRAGLSTQQKKELHLGLDTSSTSTDTLMLVHVPANGSRATLISIPRDTYVTIPGYRSGKINGAYADGYYDSGAQSAAEAQNAGASELVRTVKLLTGVPIDHYIQVGFAGFENIVKAIGSIPVTLCDSVSDPRSGFRMSAGHHNLTPTQALEFVRQRHNIPGPVSDDFGRELRQRYFLAAAFKQVLTAHVLLSPGRLNELLSAVNQSFVTDGGGFGVDKFAAQMADLSAGNITGASIPNTGTAVIDGQDVVTVDVAAVQRFVRGAFYPPTPTGTSSSAGAPTTQPATSPSTSASTPVTSSKQPTPASTGCVY